MSARQVRAATHALGAITLVACAHVPSTDAQAPRYTPTDQASAQAAKSSSRPLVLEWPAADRAALESQRTKGIVVVRYAQHEMEVLRGCRANTSYHYAAVTPKEEGLVFRSKDELDAAMPIHAVRLDAKLRENKALSVAMTIVGIYESDAREWKPVDLVGDCEGATHVVRAVAVGAFEIDASAGLDASVRAQGLGASAGASHDSQNEVLHRDGTKSACAKASASDSGPPFDCGAPLRVEVALIHYPAGAGAALAAPAVPTSNGCANGLVRRGNACVAVDPDRPALLDVLGKPR